MGGPVTATKPQRTCDVCKFDNGWHYSDDEKPRATRCPNYLSVEQHKQALQLTADAHTAAFKRAKEIIADVARHMYEFDANYVRDLFDEEDIPTSVRGSAFRWAASDRASFDGPLIEAAGDVQSTEASTRHRIYRWRSRCWRGVATG